jgi:hypothetical protein
MAAEPGPKDQNGYAIFYETHGRLIASYLVIALDEHDAEAKASALFYSQHPAFDPFNPTPGLTFRIEPRTSSVRKGH